MAESLLLLAFELSMKLPICSAIRDISSLIKPYNIPQDVNVVDVLSGVDYGDVSVNPGYIEDTYDRMVKGLSPVIDKSS